MMCRADAFIIATGTKPADSPNVPINGRTIINSDQVLQTAGSAQDPDRGRRRRDRRRVHLHVRGARRPRHPGGEAAAPAGVRRPGDRRGALLSPARQPRHAAAQRGSGARGGDRGGASSRSSRARRRSRATRCSTRSAAGQRRRAESGRRRPRGRRARPHHRRRGVPHPATAHLRRRRRDRLSRAWRRSRWSRAGSPPAFAIGTPVESNPASYPYGIYTIPEISFIGKTEEQLTDEDVPYETASPTIARSRAARFAATPPAASRSSSTARRARCSACTSSAKAPPSCCTSARPYGARRHDRLLRRTRSSTIRRSPSATRRRRSTASTSCRGSSRMRRDSSMGRAIGVLAMEHIAVALVEDHGLVGSLRVYPDDRSAKSPLQSLPADQIAETICAQIEEVARRAAHRRRRHRIPRHHPQRRRRGVAEPAAGERLQAGIHAGDAPARRRPRTRAQRRRCVRRRGRRRHAGTSIPSFASGRSAAASASVGIPRPMASGRAATCVVTLDPKEKYCGCGGIGHLEGIVGRRGHAPALPGPRTGGGVRQRTGGRPALPGLRSTSGIARWPPPRRPAFTWTAPAASSCQVPTRPSSMCVSSIATCTRW